MKSLHKYQNSGMGVDKEHVTGIQVPTTDKQALQSLSEYCRTCLNEATTTPEDHLETQVMQGLERAILTRILGGATTIDVPAEKEVVKKEILDGIENRDDGEGANVYFDKYYEGVALMVQRAIDGFLKEYEKNEALLNIENNVYMIAHDERGTIEQLQQLEEMKLQEMQQAKHPNHSGMEEAKAVIELCKKLLDETEFPISSLRTIASDVSHNPARIDALVVFLKATVKKMFDACVLDLKTA